MDKEVLSVAARKGPPAENVPMYSLPFGVDSIGVGFEAREAGGVVQGKAALLFCGCRGACSGRNDSLPRSDEGDEMDDKTSLLWSISVVFQMNSRGLSSRQTKISLCSPKNKE